MEVQINAAMSIDGKLSTRRREQIPISGPTDFDRVERLRRDFDSILVGVGTVLADDPRLGVDGEPPGAPVHPTRVVVDSQGRTPVDARIFDATAPTVVLASDQLSQARQTAYEETGATVYTAGESQVDLTAGIDLLAQSGIESLLVEGGGEIIFSVIEAGLVDRISVYIGNTVIGGREAPTLADGQGFVEEFPTFSLAAVTQLDSGVVLFWEPDG